MNLFDVGNKIAFVTGAGSGIGRRLAIGLAEYGADVACFDLSAGKALDETVDEIRKIGKKAIALQGDVINAKDIENAIGETQSRLGDVRIAINCAGIANAIAAEDMPLAQWQRLIDVNLTGIFLCCQEEFKAMAPLKEGSIINIASMSGVIVNRGLLQAHYNCSKAAVIHLTKSLAMEWCDKGIRVNAISPGYTLTPMNKRPEVAEQLKVFARDTPMGRIAGVDEMVGPAIFLASRASSFCTGINLLVDGGFVCW